jgi:hypothetical protein
MNKRRLRNAGSRPKAFFGSEAAAILGAAAINVAGSLTAAGISANATIIAMISAIIRHFIF